jgi:translation initiation factor IF-3
MFKKNYRSDQDGRDHEREPRINWQIRIPQIRVVRDEEQLGVMSPDEARKIAQELELDLVEIVPTARPPVCRIMDYGKYKYEKKMKDKEQARKQRESQVELKELRLSMGIAEHDIETKINQAKKFLSEGNKVQFNLKISGRQMAHKDQGFVVVTRIVDSLKDIANIDKAPKIEGNRIICCLGPKD